MKRAYRTSGRSACGKDLCLNAQPHIPGGKRLFVTCPCICDIWMEAPVGGGHTDDQMARDVDESKVRSSRASRVIQQRSCLF
jgi:hypothetical protein